MARDASVWSERQPEPASAMMDGEERTGVFTILVPLDGSERAERALPPAEDLCRRLDGEIALMRILPVLALPFNAPPGYIPPDRYQQMVDDQERLAREYLERVATGLQQRGQRARSYIQYGEPAAAAIMDAIPALRVSMVVMTTHGRTGFARFALGSVADGVVRGGGVPVLLMRSFASQEQTEAPRSALVPLDGSPLAEAALFTVARRLAGAVLRAIALVRVVDPRDGAEGAQAAEKYLDQARRRFVERLDGRELAVTTRMEVGAPAAGILAAARAEAPDVILMSTHGEAGLGRLAFGSVTDRLLRDGDLPMLLVRPAVGAAGALE